MARYIQKGNTINYKNTGSEAIEFEDVVVLTDRIGVAALDIPAGAVGAVNLTGVFEMPAETTAAFTVGQALYWDADNKRVTATKAQSGAVTAGIAVEPKTAAGASVLVRL